MPTISHDHSDRDEVKRCAEADFFALYLEAGGKRRGKSLTCIFHQDRTPSASIHKGRFHCFGCGISLDVIEFIERAQRTDFKGALAYLADRYGVPLDDRKLTATEKREYAHRRAAAEAEGAQLVEWKRSMVASLRSAREGFQEIYWMALSYIVRNSLDAPLGELAADLADISQPAYARLDRAIESLERASYKTLLPFFRARSRRAA